MARGVPDGLARAVEKRKLKKGDEKPSSVVGQSYAGDAVMVRPERITAYDACVGDMASPIFPVCLIKGLFEKLFEDPAFTVRWCSP